MTKEELCKLKKITAEIIQIQEELNSVEVTILNDSVTGSSIHFPYTQHQIKIVGVDLEKYDRTVKKINERLRHKLDELMDEKDRINEYIYSLDDSDIRQILSYRYVNGLTWEQIGNCIGYAAITVRVKHDKFMKTVSTNITSTVLQ